MNKTTMRIGLLLGALLVAVSVLLAQSSDPWMKKKLIETPKRMNALRNAPNRLAQWPPQLGSKFPEVQLFDHEGKPFSMQSMRGKPTLIEFVAMTCAACQAWSGGNKKGGFEGFLSQHNLQSIEEYYKEFTGGHNIFSSDINFVQLVVYNLHLNPPSPANLSAWRKHFGFNQHANTFVISGGEPLANRESFHRIPGFMLLDRDLVVRFDALGHRPRHNLFTQLLKAVPGMIASSH